MEREAIHAATSKRKKILWLLHASQAPGTTRSRHRFFSEEIYFTVSKIHRFSVLNRGFQCERPEVFREHCACHVNTLGVRDEFSNLG